MQDAERAKREKLLASFWGWRRIAAIRALTTLPAEHVVDPIGARIEDRSWKVRLEAVRALSQIEDARAIPYLLRACRKNWAEEKEPVLEAATDALTRKGKAGAPVLDGLLVVFVEQGKADLLQPYVNRLLKVLRALGPDERFVDPLKVMFRQLGDLSLTKYGIARVLEDMGRGDADTGTVIATHEGAFDRLLAGRRST